MVELDDEDVDLVVALARLFEKHNLIDIKFYSNKWLMDARFRDTQHCRTKLCASAAEALTAAIAGRARMAEAENGKRQLQELLHTGEVSKTDVEWAIGRFNERGEFLK